MTVKPVNANDIIASTTILPKVFQKSVVGNRHLPSKVVCHQVYDTLVLRILVIRLQAPEHNHLCPKFAFSIAFVDRAEITVRLATGKYAFDPVFGFFYHLRIIQNICQTAIPFEPIGNFLPTMVPTGRKPSVVILSNQALISPKCPVRPSRCNSRNFLTHPSGRMLPTGNFIKFNGRSGAR